MIIFFIRHPPPHPPSAFRYPVFREVLREPPRFEPIYPCLPQAGVAFPDILHHRKIARRAHKAADTVHPLCVKRIIGSLLPEQVEPHVKRGPMLDRCRGELIFYPGVPPHPFALHPLCGLVLSLADEREAFAPLAGYQVPDRLEFAYPAAPAEVNRRGTLAAEGIPEFLLSRDSQDLETVFLLCGVHVCISLGKLETGVDEDERDISVSLSLPPAGLRGCLFLRNRKPSPGGHTGRPHCSRN